MDILLAVCGGLLILLGFLGCILPMLPGPPLAFVGMLLIHFTKYADFTLFLLIVCGAITIISVVLDYVIPIWGTKKFGGSNYGAWGATIGLFVGLFFGPPGFILGPILGAIIGELIHGEKFNAALKAGLGSFIGFMLGTGIKLAVVIAMIFYTGKEVFFN